MTRRRRSAATRTRAKKPAPLVIPHTPGPWTTGQNGDSCAKGHAICSGPYVIAKVYAGGYPAGVGWSPASQADANLIAIAPDLRLLVAEALDHFSDDNSRIDLRDWVKAARAVLMRLKVRS